MFKQIAALLRPKPIASVAVADSVELKPVKSTPKPSKALKTTKPVKAPVKAAKASTKGPK